MAERLTDGGIIQTSAFERDRIADVDRPALHDLPERPAAPVRAQRGAESRLRFVHPFARGDLAVDADEARADAQQLAARLLEVDAADHHVGAAGGGVDVDAELADGVAPRLFADDRDLALAALIGVAADPAAGHELGAVDAVHHAAAGAFDPDG